jgi:hypothetical protein
MVLELDPAGTGKVLPCDASTQLPYGLAIESNVKFPLAPATGDPAGQGYDYTNFNRGGKLACFINGGEFELSDDGRGSPIAAVVFAINGPVHSTSAGLVSSAAVGPVIGTVVDYDVASSPTRLRIKLLI